MSTFDELVAQIWGPPEIAAYSGEVSPNEVRLAAEQILQHSEMAS